MTEAEAFQKLQEITNPESEEAMATAIAATIDGQTIVLAILTIRRAVFDLERNFEQALKDSEGTAQDYNGEMDESVQLVKAGAEGMMLDAARAIARASAEEEGREFVPDEPGPPDGCGHCFACLMLKAQAERGNN